ncbi:ankyrin repeat domain-containing protein [Candidatus Dependentiae bacterium]|nr:ankyrin repeat domain-containing protein [Candidatus Dependentiae bacterium]MBU4387451.1 ankyrin repeat domain-containing protein [Candidatus Dependentiae bacterium]MCG2756711.1 ankyrin repeat domain-containing protein [Candidatus Dependentiae bacterium]
MNISKIVKFYTYLILILLTPSLFAISSEDMAGSYDCIKDEQYKIASPLLGAKLWEAHTIWNFYKLLPKNDPIRQLAEEFFHENQGQFLETNLDRKAAKYLDIKSIGEIIGIILNLDIKSKKKFEDKFNKINIVIENKEANENLNKIKNLIWKSESKKKLDFYPEKTTILVLEALAYRKMDNKDDLKIFFNAIASSLDKKIEDLVDIEILDSDNWHYTNLSYLLETDNIIESQIPIEYLLMKQIGAVYKGALPKISTYKYEIRYGNFRYADCADTTLRNLINIALFRNDEFNINKLNKDFKEIFEFYKKQKPTDVEDRDIHDSWAEVISNKEYFVYKNLAKEGLSVNKPETQEDVIGFIILPKDHEINLDNATNVEIYINQEKYLLKKITIGIDKDVRSYLIVDRNNVNHEDLICYELKACAENFIIGLNKCLDLDLSDYDQKKILKTGFIEKFLEHTIRACGLYINNKSGSVNGEFSWFLQKEESRFILNVNYGSSGGHAEIPQSSIENKQTEILNKRILDKIIKGDNFVLMTGILDVVDAKLNTIFAIDFLRPVNRLKFIEKNLNSDDNLIIDLVKNLIESIDFLDVDLVQKFTEFVKKNYSNFKNNFNEKAIETAKKSIKFNDIMIHNKAVELWSALLEKGFGFEAMIEFITSGTDYKDQQTREAALNLLWNLLLEKIGNIEDVELKNKEFDNVIKAANKCLELNNYYQGISYWKSILTTVVKVENIKFKDRVFDEAIRTAENIKIERDDSENENFIAHHFWVMLFECIEDVELKSKLFDKAIKTANKFDESNNSKAQDLALHLFEMLVDKDKAVKQAIAAANKYIESNNSDLRESAIELFTVLVENGQSFKEAIVVANNGIEDEDVYIRMDSLQLFIALVKKNQAFKKAIDAANKGIEDEDAYIKRVSFDLFAALVEKNQALEEAIAALLKIENNSDVFFGSLCDILVVKLKEYIQRGKKFELVINTAKEAIKVDVIKNFSLKLWDMLFDKGWGFIDAIELVEANIEKNELINLLLSKEDFYKSVNKDSTYLMYAATYGKLNFAQLLIDKKIDDINAKNKEGWTALMYAAYLGNKNVVELLIKNGAKINEKNKEGKTAYSLLKNKKVKKEKEELKKEILKILSKKR